MTSKEIQQRIFDLVDQLNEITPKWAKSKANKNYSDEMKKAVLNTVKSASNRKTVSAREEEAYASKEYTEYLWKAFKVDGEFYSLDGKRNLIEKELDAMRTLLSYEKSMINITK